LTQKFSIEAEIVTLGPQFPVVVSGCATNVRNLTQIFSIEAEIVTLGPQFPVVVSGCATNVRNLTQKFSFWSNSVCTTLSRRCFLVKFRVHNVIQAFAPHQSNASVVSMGGTGGKKGGSGGQGGSAAKKRSRETETPAQKTARCDKRSATRRALLSSQGATHRLNRIIHGTDEAEESAKVDEKRELDMFFGALVKACGVLGQQGKMVAVQAQYAQVGKVEIQHETDKSEMRNMHKGVELECAATPLCRVQLTNKVPVSASHAHELETHAQRCLMLLTSFDPNSNVVQLYNASALPVDGWSVLRTAYILAGGDRVLVITITLYKGNPGVAAQLSPARSDNVFGPGHFKVSWMECTWMQMHCNELMLPVWFTTETVTQHPGHTCHGDSQHHQSGPARPPRSPPLH